MLIDFHTHVFPEKIAYKTIKMLEENSNGKAFTDGTVDGLLAAMGRAEADISVALPVLTKPTQFESVTLFAKSVNEKFQNKNKKIISFAGMHPCCDDIKGKMKYLKEQGFLGVKIHPDYQATFIDDEGYIEILKCAKDNDLIVVTHSGIDDGYAGQPVRCPPELVLKVIEKVNHKKFVLGHYGAHKQWEKVLSLLAGNDVFFDTAFTLHEISEKLFIDILEKHGEDKILFATDCPWRDIVDDKNIFLSYNISKEVKEKILYKNAIKLLNLENK